MMNAEQREKALEALEKKKELDRKQHRAMAFHLMAFGKLHFNKVLLPYRILYDIEKRMFEKTFHEVPPNEFYPAPAMTLKTKYLQPTISSTMDIDELERQRAEYKKIVDTEKMDSDKWDYYFARFLLPYDLISFTDFDFWGKVPEGEIYMNQAEYERMVKIYNYVYSTLPNTPEREKRLAEIGEEDSSKLWDFYCGICSGRIKEPERTNSEVNTMGEKKIASYEDFIKALRYGENNMLCKFSETILKDMLIMLNRWEQVLDVKIRRKHEILNG